MAKSKTSNKSTKSSSTGAKSKMNLQVEKVKFVAPEVTIQTENNTVNDTTTENRNINTPISNIIERDNRKMISFKSVKQVLDSFTSSFVEYGRHLYSKYNQENDNSSYERLMKKSYLRNVRFILNPTWVDMNDMDDFEYPNYKNMDDMNSLFYMISEENRNSWLFQGVVTFDEKDQFSDELLMEAFQALISGVYHEEFMANNYRSYYYFTYYLDMLKHILDKNNINYTENIYHIGSLLQINDGISSLYQPYTNVEACVATRNLVMMIHSLTTMKRNNISGAMASFGFDDNDIKTYINYILTPFFGVIYALRRLDMENDLITIESDIYNTRCVTIPHSSWKDENDFDEEEYRREREEAMKLHRAKRALEEEARKRVIDSISVYDLPRGPALVLNKRFAQKIDEERAAAAASSKSELNTTISVNSRASAFVTETTSVKSSPTSSVSSSINTNHITYVSPDFVFEHDKVPKSMRRNDKKDVNGRDEGFLLFFSGTDSDTVFERNAFSTPNGRCSIRDACRELPRLLVEKERLLRTSRNLVFGKSLEELFQTDVKKRSLYYTNLRRAVISFCNEISATTRFDNAGRMEIIQRYYGERRQGETERMYINSFMFDVFRPFVNFYTYVKDK